MVIHFGNFVRWHRLKKQWKQHELAKEAKVATRTIINIEKSPEPANDELTIVSVAQALGFRPEDFESTWRNTPVPVPMKEDPIPKLWKQLDGIVSKLSRASRKTPTEILIEATKRASWPTKFDKAAKRKGRGAQP
jgi:DNA-binding XRE family transcriptional regulator